MFKTVGAIMLALVLELAFAGHGLALDNLAGLPSTTSGAGLTTVNLDDDPRPEVFFAWIEDVPDDQGGGDWVYFKYAANIDDSGNASWGPTYKFPYALGYHNQGLGISIGDIDDNDYKDIIFVAIDNPTGENKIWYAIGWDFDFSQSTENFGNWKKVTDVDVGSETDGAGSGLFDIDGNGRPDLVVAWADDPEGPNNFYYVIFWNLDKYGYSDEISDRIEVRSDWHPDFNAGLGLELVNLDDDPAPEFVLSVIDQPFESQANGSYYMVGWNMGPDGKVS